jgi:hypothetical protein
LCRFFFQLNRFVLDQLPGLIPVWGAINSDAIAPESAPTTNPITKDPKLLDSDMVFSCFE